MKTAMSLGLAALMLSTAFSISAARPEAEDGAGFNAVIIGVVAAGPDGEARFGATGDVFTISLGATGQEGSVLFTRPVGGPFAPGSYPISDHADGRGVRALIMTGPATRPTGVFQGRSGTLVITSVSEREVRGTFRLGATGFLATHPDSEDRPVEVACSFIATR